MNFIKSIIKIVFICMIFCNSSVFAEENYDPKHTMLALNMAIVSVHRIVSSKDRNVLTLEYNNIINNLKIGNIESDYEMTSLYTELMDVISNKTLRQEDCSRILARYKKNEQRAVFNAISGIRAYGGDWKSWLLSLATSWVSQYFSYRNIKEDLQDTLDDDLWRLKEEEIRDCNELQKKLLSSSWNLLRKYKLSDDYRLTQDSLNAYYTAITSTDYDKKLRILRSKKNEFLVYPPYWMYRAQAAQAMGYEEEAKMCYEEFDKVWRPVLSKDPYKQTFLKYQVSEMLKAKSIDKTKTKALLEDLLEYTNDDDWSNKIFIGIIFNYIGETEKAINTIQLNIDLNKEVQISQQLIDKIKAGGKEIGEITVCSECLGIGKVLRGNNEFSFTCKECDGSGTIEQASYKIKKLVRPFGSDWHFLFMLATVEVDEIEAIVKTSPSIYKKEIEETNYIEESIRKSIGKSLEKYVKDDLAVSLKFADELFKNMESIKNSSDEEFKKKFVECAYEAKKIIVFEIINNWERFQNSSSSEEEFLGKIDDCAYEAIKYYYENSKQ